MTFHLVFSSSVGPPTLVDCFLPENKLHFSEPLPGVNQFLLERADLHPVIMQLLTLNLLKELDV